MKKFITLIFLLILIENLTAQNFEIGGEVGIGKSSFLNQTGSKSLFGRSPMNNFTGGVTCSIKVRIPDFAINTGILYQHRVSFVVFDFIKMPIGFLVETGKKAQFQIGGGAYISHLCNTSGSTDPDFKDLTYDFLAGVYLKSGARYRISRHLSIYLHIQFDYDVTPTYKEPIFDHWGHTYYQNIRAYDYSFSFGLRYIIQKKQVKSESNKTAEIMRGKNMGITNMRMTNPGMN